MEGGSGMDYTALMREAIEFIHSQYGENILVSDISAQVYLSPSYFAYLFRTLTGYTVKNYLNRYRLYRAAAALKETDKRIIEIAFECGFSSQQAFTKSFSLLYGTSPAQFRRADITFNPFPPSNILQKRGITMDLKNVFDNVRFVKKDSFLVVGIETDINYNGIGKGTDYISDLYDRWNTEKLIEKIPDQVNDLLTYGMTHESNADDTAKYIIAVEVSSLEHLPAGLIGRRFEACEYAVFECTLEEETSGRFFQYFFSTWLKEQGLSQPDSVHTALGNTFSRYPTFEVYDKNFVDASSKIEIYIPITRE